MRVFGLRRVVYASSAAVFNGYGSGAGPIANDTLLYPKNVYGNCKAFNEPGKDGAADTGGDAYRDRTGCLRLSSKRSGRTMSTLFNDLSRPSGVTRWALGSVADRLIRGKTPVLSVRPSALKSAPPQSSQEDHARIRCTFGR